MDRMVNRMQGPGRARLPGPCILFTILSILSILSKCSCPCRHPRLAMNAGVW